MFGKLRSIFPALAVGMAAASMGEIATRGMVPAIDYGSPRFGRHNLQRTSTGPGKSPAVAGPHSEPHVHVRSRSGVHYWFTQDQWDVARSAKVPFRLTVGDVIERVDGYGAVTMRTRVTA